MSKFSFVILVVLVSVCAAYGAESLFVNSCELKCKNGEHCIVDPSSGKESCAGFGTPMRSERATFCKIKCKCNEHCNHDDSGREWCAAHASPSSCGH